MPGLVVTYLAISRGKCSVEISKHDHKMPNASHAVFLHSAAATAWKEKQKLPLLEPCPKIKLAGRGGKRREEKLMINELSPALGTYPRLESPLPSLPIKDSRSTVHWHTAPHGTGSSSLIPRDNTTVTQYALAVE